MLAAVFAARWTGRSDWFRWSAAGAAGIGVLLLAALGAARLLAHPAVGWRAVAAGSLVSAAGIWAGVPETGPAVVVGGVLGGLAGSSLATGLRWAPTAGVGAAAVLGWAALGGAVGRPWAVAGGALCTGVAPWLALRPLLPTLARSREPGLWLLGAHCAMVVAAARWIGVVPNAGWIRVAVLAAVGLAVVLAVRPRA